MKEIKKTETLSPLGEQALERKEKRKQARDAQAKSQSNLDFLSAWLTRIGKSATRASLDAGFSANAVGSWLKQDTTSLSNIERLMNAYGWQMVYKFYLPEQDGPVGDVWLTLPVQYNIKTGELRPGDGQKRLSFLEEAIISSGLTKTKVAEDMNWSRQMLQYLFKQQDMQIADVIRIGKFYGWKLRVCPVKLGEFPVTN